MVAFIDSTRTKKFNLGTYDTMVAKTCEHVAFTNDGKCILASTNTTVEMYNSTSKNSIASVPVAGHVAGFQSYQDHLYVAIELIERGDRVIVYDQQYAQVRHWLTEVKVCDLAVNNEKVYLASTESKIHVFSTSGTVLYEISDGGGTRIASHPMPDILIVTNHQDDKVYGLNGDTKEVLWSSSVDKPWGVSIDEYETVWVWSEFQQGIAIFDDKGKDVLR